MLSGLRLLVASLLLTTAACAQDINLSYTDVSLDTIVKALKLKGRFSIFYSSDVVAFSHVSFTIQHATPREALGKLLRDFPIRFEVTSERPLNITLTRYPNTQLSGQVFGHDKVGTPDLTIELLNKDIRNTTDEKGYYNLAEISASDTLLITGVNIQPKYVYPEGRIHMDIEVSEKVDSLPVYTKTAKPYIDGYHTIKPPQAPAASSYQLDEEAMRRIPSLDILGLTRGQISGLLSGTGDGGAQTQAIHGTSSLFASRDPLYIVDQFPLDADLLVINPLDLESVNVLKDAPAAAPWGARSANGVFVYAPRTGEITGRKTKITIDINTTYTLKPDAHYNAGLDPMNYSALEQQLFALSMYDPQLADPSHPAVSPNVDILDRQRRGLLSPAQADAMIRTNQQHSSADDMDRWFLQPSIRQQYHLGLAAGDSLRQHYVSAGIDRDNTNYTRNGLDRLTLYDSYDQQFGKFQLSTRLQYAHLQKRTNSTGQPPVNYTYADDNHPVNYIYSPSFARSFGGGQLLSMLYTPTQELALADKNTTTSYYSAQTSLRLNISPGLFIKASTRFMYQPVVTRDHISKDAFPMRDLINHFTDLSGPEPVYHVPIGDLLTETTDASSGQYFRGLVNYTSPKTVAGRWSYSLQFGAECSEVALHTIHRTLLGYDARHNTSIPIDAQTLFPDLITGDLRQIPYDQSTHDLYTRNQAFFGDIRLNWKEKLSIYITGKWDGTNIVGVNTNRQFSPFTAFGLLYDPLHRPGKSALPGTPYRLRASFGSNGNVGSRIGYLVTQALEPNPFGALQSGIANPPDPNLSWEKTYTANLGIDFNFLRTRRIPEGRILGSLDIYYKFAHALLGNDSLQLSTGLNSFFGNNAGLRGQGFDLVINTENLFRPFRWTSRLLLSYFRDWITRYPFEPPSTSAYVTANTPRKDYPATALFSFRDASLDPADGSPRGFLNGTITRSYDDIINGKDYSSITYSGSSQPAFFGSLLNTFSFEKWSFSFMIAFKTSYVFRKSSINYYTFTNLQDPGNNDYLTRWKRSGDEKITNVPAPPKSSNDFNRSLFHEYSASLIIRGDHVRLQDIRITYDLLRQSSREGGPRLITLFLYIDQPFIIWRANKYHLDPEAYTPGVLKPTPGFTLGIHTEF